MAKSRFTGYTILGRYKGFVVIDRYIVDTVKVD